MGRAPACCPGWPARSAARPPPTRPAPPRRGPARPPAPPGPRPPPRPARTPAPSSRRGCRAAGAPRAGAGRAPPPPQSAAPARWIGWPRPAPPGPDSPRFPGERWSLPSERMIPRSLADQPAAKVPGRLADLRVSEGSFVRKGETIARLENADYRAQVAQAEANLSTARAQLIEAEAERDQLQREARRLRDIRAENSELVSAQDVEGAEARAAQADARGRAGGARVESAEAGLRFAQASLDNTLVRAPFTGTVLRKEAEVGEVVAPSVGGGLTRGAVVTMADLTTLEVEVDVNEAYIARITRDQAARIILDAYPDTSFQGRVRQVVPTADRQRATVQVKVSILDRDPRILPEMGARVDFLEPERPRGEAPPPPPPPTL